MWTMNIHNVRGSSENYEEIHYHDFGLTGSNNVLYSTGTFGNNYSCGFIPNGLGARLFRDGQTTGNVCVSVPTDETGLTFLYDERQEDANGNPLYVKVWFKALPE